MNSKQRQTLEAIFTNPVRATIKWQDIEALLVAIGCEVSEGNGSRVRFTLRGRTLFIHRPHPKPDTKQYVVRTVREFLTDLGIKP
ncbi:type II toxin-antitoxin system HicA family toxin [Rhizobium sp. RCC_161_2]|uniref:type II toxin-antitoxin system HicA family toxin n=1 Tax=Rhizobium sp. RCC_161_2 TaxID=3239219 RepID=UPI0035262156